MLRIRTSDDAGRRPLVDRAVGALCIEAYAIITAGKFDAPWPIVSETQWSSMTSSTRHRHADADLSR